MSKNKNLQKASQKIQKLTKMKFEKVPPNSIIKNQKSKKILMKRQKSFLIGGASI